MAWMRLVSGPCVVFLGTVACMSEGPPRRGGALAEVHAPIIDGTPDPGESGVVYVTHLDYPFLCSGTVVHPQLVTTAKHCTFRERSGPDLAMAGDRFRVGFGPSQANLTWRGTVRMEWIGMPGSVEVQPSVDAGEDIALLYLAGSVPAGTRVHDVKLDYFPASGDKITIVGYGRSSLSSSAAGVKRTTTDDFNGFDAATGILQTTGKGACSGDSGGAFFFGTGRELVGVTSTAGGSSTSSFCDIGITQATSVRNANVNRFLFDALSALGTCLQQPEICGDGLDQDCDGVADNQCTPDGAACTADVQCQNGLCDDLGTGPRCIRLCDETVKCPATSRCVVTDGCSRGYCEAGAQGVGKLLQACSDHQACATNHCSAEGCTRLCRSTLGECPDGMACAVGATCGECLDEVNVAGPRHLGESCTSTADCDADGECKDDGFGVLRCAMPCFEGESCPGGFRCRDGQCLRTGGFSNGDRCTGPDDCASFLCAVVSGEPERSFCTRPCTTATECGTGFDCAEKFGQMVCVPDGLLLGEECVADSQCTSRQCDVDLGVCTRACDPRTVACPAGFTCEVLRGDLRCVPAPGAWPAGPEPVPDSGASGTAGSTGGTGVGAGTGGAAGVPAAGAPSAGGTRAEPSSGGDDGGCGCVVPGERRSPASVFAPFAVALLVARRRASLRAPARGS